MSRANSGLMPERSVRPAAVQLRIGRVVWHGPGAPDARALEAAIAAALSHALSQGPAPVAASALAHAGQQVADRLVPRLAGGAA